MPPIKRTKFKLAPEQLLEMFYWLKLMRAFDLRLSTLVKQGKVRSGVYTGIGQEAIIVGTCFGLRREDFICPLHRDLGSFLMKGVEPRVMMSQMFAKTTGLSKGREHPARVGLAPMRAVFCRDFTGSFRMNVNRIVTVLCVPVFEGSSVAGRQCQERTLAVRGHPEQERPVA